MAEFAPDETEEIGDFDEANPDGFVIGKKQKQSQQKKARKIKKPNSSLKQQDLIRLNVTDPQTKEEAISNAEVLLDMLKNALLVSFVLSNHRFLVSSHCKTAILRPFTSSQCLPSSTKHVHCSGSRRHGQSRAK
jgi:hypothetical protein